MILPRWDGVGVAPQICGPKVCSTPVFQQNSHKKLTPPQISGPKIRPPQPLYPNLKPRHWQVITSRHFLGKYTQKFDIPFIKPDKGRIEWVSHWVNVEAPSTFNGPTAPTSHGENFAISRAISAT